MSINRVIISGNLTRDPDLRQTASGTSVLGFGMAVNDRRKNNQTGEWEDFANFVDCTMFGQRAQAISQYLRKGLKVAVEGKLRYSSWDRDGQKHSKLEVVVDELEFMSGRGESQQQGGYGGGVSPQVAYAAQQAQAASGYGMPRFEEMPDTIYDEDIPFGG